MLPQRTLSTGSVSNCPDAKMSTDFGTVMHGEAKEGEIHAMGLGCDVSSEESVKAAFAKIKQEFGRVDVRSNLSP